MIKKQRITIIILLFFCVFSVVFMICVLSSNTKVQYKFVPPKFEENVISDVTEVPDELGYSELDAEAYKVGICGNLISQNGTVDIYFTNNQENKVWLKLRVYDDSENIIAETGLIKAGECMKSIELSKNYVGDVRIKIMSYEPETYYSMGTVTLNAKLKMRGDVNE